MQLRTEVEILAPVERVWSALCDVRRYPEWNPFILRVDGEFAPGKSVSLKLGSAEGSERTLRAEVCRVEQPRELRFEERRFHPRLFRGDHFFLLTPLEPNKTRVAQGADYDGLLLPHVNAWLTDFARGFVGMNQALKRRVEGSER